MIYIKEITINIIYMKMKENLKLKIQGKFLRILIPEKLLQSYFPEFLIIYI
jgi:hypothetical protein